MSYATVQGAVATVLQGLTGSFADSAQVTQNDWSVLDRGYDNIAVLFPGPFQDSGGGAGNSRNITWTVHIALFRRIPGSYADALTAFVTLRDAVRLQIQKYPALGLVGVLTVLDLTGDEPLAVGDEADGGPFFILETLDLQVQEDVETAPLG